MTCQENFRVEGLDDPDLAENLMEALLEDDLLTAPVEDFTWRDYKVKKYKEDNFYLIIAEHDLCWWQ